MIVKGSKERKIKKFFAKPLPAKLLRHKSLIAIIIFALVVSSWLMLSTLSYSDGYIEVSGHMWSDFLSHIPLVRSFSEGANIPPESPLFGGERIKYHFLFYLLAGGLEAIGMRIDVAINILSIVGMVGMLVGIYLLAKKITKSKGAGWLAVLLFFFNSSFSWLYYLSSAGLGLTSLNEVITNSDYAAFGPYDDKLISAFWTLNVYTNQRHLGLSFGLMFLAVWGIYYSKKRWGMALGVLVFAIMPWLNKAMLLLMVVTLGLLFLSNRRKRKRVVALSLAGGLLALPGITYLSDVGAVGENGFRVWWGFLYKATTWEGVNVPAGILRWIVYWFLNLGLLPILAIVGLFKVERFKKIKLKGTYWDGLEQLVRYIITPTTVWFWSAVITFVIANSFVFATDPATNHKLINYVAIIFNIYAAYVIVKLFTRKTFPIAIILLIGLTLGGIFDLFPIVNNSKALWADFSTSKTATWLRDNTDPKATIFNLTYEVAPAGTAGRKIYYGWDYLNWSIGYDVFSRKDILQKAAQGQYSKEELCNFLRANNFSYILMNSYTEKFVEVDVNKRYFEDNFVAPESYEEDFPVILYDTDRSCADV
ncbi:MAG: hypothetical protein ACE5DX_04245 [Candidatus Dojkabacteria bacterium]